MAKTITFLLVFAFTHTAYSQEFVRTWSGTAEYLPGVAITTTMKNMAAEKKLVFDVNSTGAITGDLYTTYNRVKATLPQEGDDQRFLVIGRFDDGQKILLLVITHLKSKPDNPGSYLTFKKPDSVYYDLTYKQEKDKMIITGTYDPVLNRSATECVGSPQWGGLGMNSNAMNLHLLPLRIKFENAVTDFSHLASLGFTDSIPALVKEAAVYKPITTVIRKTQIQKSIELESPNLRIDLYDNGVVDGDTATLILDGKTIINKHRLAEKAFTLNLTLSEATTQHVLELYANSQGAIPPNTALVVITCNKKRYEINLASNEYSNGGISLVFKNTQVLAKQ
jgi:hypothetical protein